MEPVLDEASLRACPVTSPAERVRRLGEALVALDALGVPRVLRSVRDAADRDLAGGRGLRQWCFDNQTPRDTGLLVALRLAMAPFIDGADGLFAAAEAGRAVEPSIDGTPSLGGGHVALTDGVLVILGGSTWPPTKPVVVHLDVLTEADAWTDDVTVDAVDGKEEVAALAAPIVRKVDTGLASGAALVARLPELWSRLVLGARAEAQLAALSGSEPFYPQVLRHLRALDRAAGKWTPSTPFAPDGVTFSVESAATLTHGTYGPLRSFPTPSGFVDDRWTLHTKLTGGPGARLYYKTREVEVLGSGGEPVRQLRVAVGYVGPHLDTARFHQ